MALREAWSGRRLDILALVVAGAVNTLLAPTVAGFSFGPGPLVTRSDFAARALWVAVHVRRWQLGWAFWCVVTASFAWSFYALSRHLGGPRQWRDLAVGVAVAAALVDLAGIAVNAAVVPRAVSLHRRIDDASRLAGDTALVDLIKLGHLLTDVAAYGLYSVAGLLLLPALFGKRAYPRTLAWLGAAEWSVSGIASVLLAVDPSHASVPLILSFALYAPWVWGSAVWLARTSSPIA